jgi:hypothetical protein
MLNTIFYSLSGLVTVQNALYSCGDRYLCQQMRSHSRHLLIRFLSVLENLRSLWVNVRRSLLRLD